MKKVFVLTVICALLVGSLYAASIEEEFNKTLDLKSGAELSVKNVNGKIQVESWDKEEVKIFAEIKVKNGSRRSLEKFMEKVEITIEGDENDLEIGVDYPKKKGSSSFLKELFGNKKPQVTVSFSLMVPKKCDLEASSVNGAVYVENVNGSAELRTVNGSVKAQQMKGAVDAHTTNGSINVEIDDTELSDDMRFKTVNGSVKVFLPGDIKADLSVSTVNGRIKTDFPVTVEGKWGPKKIRGEINGGGNEIDISTVNGGVSLNSI